MNIDAIHLYTASETLVGPTKFAELNLSQVGLSESYILEQAFGLDIEDVAAQPYGYYHDDNFFKQVPAPRTIVLKIKLNPDYTSGETPADLRDHLYKTVSFTMTSLNEIRFVNDGDDIAYIRGFVTKFESDIFTPDPKIQITYLCPYFFLRGLNPVVDEDAILGDPGYEGEIEPGEPGFILELPGSEDVPVIFTDQISTAPHGFFAELEYIGGMPVSGVTVFQDPTDGDPQWEFGLLLPGSDPFTSGDILLFSSDDTDKYIRRNRSGTIINLVDTVLPGSVWPKMLPGETVIEIGFFFKLTALSYIPHYWGV